MNGEILIHGQNHTHLPLLIAAVMQSRGPVLELGCGNASTPNLHSLLLGTGRKLYSVDDNPDWVSPRFDSLKADWHQLILRKPGEWPAMPESNFGAVLIDGSSGGQRIGDILRLKHAAEFIVIHDTEAEGYGYAAVWDHFIYRVDDRRYSPWTTCVSNARELQWP